MIPLDGNVCGHSEVYSGKRSWKVSSFKKVEEECPVGKATIIKVYVDGIDMAGREEKPSSNVGTTEAKSRLGVAHAINQSIQFIWAAHKEPQ